MSSPITKLQLTSCLFATTVLHAYAKRQTKLHFLCLAVTVLSILNHSTKNKTVRKLDIVFAHLLCLYALFSLAKSPLLCMVIVIMVIWLIEKRSSELLATNLHASIHLIAICGIHYHLHAF